MLRQFLLTLLLIVGCCAEGHCQPVKDTVLYFNTPTIQKGEFESLLIDSIVKPHPLANGVPEIDTLQNASSFIYSTLKDANLYEMCFRHLGNFRNSTFNGYADFNTTIFNDVASFRYAAFNGPVDFRFVSFKEVTFAYCKFNTSVWFCRLNPDAFGFSNTDSLRIKFRNAYLPDTIDFSNNPDIKNEIDLANAQFLDTYRDSTTRPTNIVSSLRCYFLPHAEDSVSAHYHYINLYNSDVSKFHLDYSHFRLYFMDVDYDASVKHGLKIKLSPISFMAACTVYEKLLKNFRERAQINDAEKLDIDYKWFKAKHRNGWMQFWQGTIPDWWWRFGYQKGRVFEHIVFFLLLFTFISYWMVGYLQWKIYAVENISNKEPKDSFGKPLERHWGWFSAQRLWYAIIYTFIVFFVFTLKLENLSFRSTVRGVLGTLYVVIVSAMGLLCLGYAANFVLQK